MEGFNMREPLKAPVIYSAASMIKREVPANIEHDCSINAPNHYLGNIQLKSQHHSNGFAQHMLPFVQRYSKEAPVQFGKWSKSKVERYKHHLRRRAGVRKSKGKLKTTHKLLRKYVNARQKYDPSWRPRLADATVAGHHVPPLALSNNLGGGFSFGKRGSVKERDRERLYFLGTKAEREEQHWMMHEAEGMQGVNRSGKYNGTEHGLAKDMVLAHTGLKRGSKRLRASVLTQNDRKNGSHPADEDLGAATRKIMKRQLPGFSMGKVVEDDSSSDAESDEARWLSDSDDE